MSRLEEIVRSLESGTAPLDESLTMFEEGVHLVSLCNSTLDKAERKIKMIEKKSGGEKVNVPESAINLLSKAKRTLSSVK